VTEFEQPCVHHLKDCLRAHSGRLVSALWAGSGRCYFVDCDFRPIAGHTQQHVYPTTTLRTVEARLDAGVTGSVPSTAAEATQQVDIYGYWCRPAGPLQQLVDSPAFEFHSRVLNVSPQNIPAPPSYSYLRFQTLGAVNLH
jgi:hypothetical protein